MITLVVNFIFDRAFKNKISVIYINKNYCEINEVSLINVLSLEKCLLYIKKESNQLKGDNKSCLL